ncbi:MAG: hypothetical protein HZC55_15695 [Verrucomicrobia bacterium]|nr:hypothetical protein [Verrucomicrobiota bacterium]
MVVASGVLGFVAMLVQLSLLRELLGTFSGNELVAGIALGTWLLFTGLGARLGDTRPARNWGLRGLSALWWFIAWVPLAQFLALRAGRDLLAPSGGTAGVVATLVGCAAALSPFCLLSGMAITLSARLAPQPRPHGGIGRIYLADTLGALSGCVAFAGALACSWDHATVLGVATAGALVAAVTLEWQRRSFTGVTAGLVSATALAAVFAGGDVEVRSLAWRYRGEIVHRASAASGPMVATRESGQLTIFINGVPVVDTDNVASTEEAAHFALLQRPSARDVLLIGGVLSGTAREILQHYPARVTAIESDPRLLDVGAALLPANLRHPRLRLLTTDPRRFIQQTDERFDVILIDLPDPSTLSLNRLFTLEFLAATRRILRPDGIVAFGLGRYHNYLGEELSRMLACAHRTVREVYPVVALFPGGRVFFAASAAPLVADLAGRLDALAISPRWVNRGYLAAMLQPDRQADLMRAISLTTSLNRDFEPALYFYHLHHWLSQFSASAPAFAWIVLALTAVAWWRCEPDTRILFAGGLAGIALELVLLLAFQILYGSLYQQVGMVVAAFMAGLAIGGGWASRSQRQPGRNLCLLGFGLALLAAGLPPFLRLHDTWQASLLGAFAGQVLLLGITGVVGAAVGAQLPTAAAVVAGNARPRAGRLFGADLLGAACGTLLLAPWLIPRCGLTATCLMVAGLNLGTAALAWRKLSSS